LGAERIKGYRADEIMGKNYSSVLSAEERADGKPARDLAIALAIGRFETRAGAFERTEVNFGLTSLSISCTIGMVNLLVLQK